MTRWTKKHDAEFDRLTGANKNRDLSCQGALVNGKVYNEAGEQMVDFEDQKRDCLDFASVSRQQLLGMLREAYMSGMADSKKGR